MVAIKARYQSPIRFKSMAHDTYEAITITHAHKAAATVIQHSDPPYILGNY